MPKEDNDKSGESIFPKRPSGWYWYDKDRVPHQVDLSISYNPTTNEAKYEIEREPICPITEEGDLKWGDGPIAKTFNYNDMIMWENVEKAKQKERYCFFLDIDGTLLKHFGDKPEQFEDKIEVLPGVREFFSLCGKNGHTIILTSGRRESFRKITEKQLRNACIPYDQLILGCTNAIRVLVNDTKPYREDSPATALCFNLVRDEGVQKLVDFLKGQ
jgi:hypothetical protein